MDLTGLDIFCMIPVGLHHKGKSNKTEESVILYKCNFHRQGATVGVINQSEQPRPAIKYSYLLNGP
jgi:hypothetical protein